MILQALYEYYKTKASDPSNLIAPEGWEWKEIPYRIIINNNGEFMAIEDLREGEGRNRRAKKFLLPQSVKRTSGIKANLLWDNLEYTLGVNLSTKGDSQKKFNLFKERIKSEIDLEKTPSVKSLLKFLENEPLKQIKKSLGEERWKEIVEENPFVVFKIDNENHNSICDDIRDKTNIVDSDTTEGICLITGKKDKIARLHPAIKGVRGGNTQGGALVSFNLPSFNSYSKKQNYNSPISQSAAFAYTTALNVLLGKDSQNKIVIADTTVVFWSSRKIEIFNPEEIFPWLISMQKNEHYDPDVGTIRIKKLFEAIETGQLSSERTNHFYVLGLAPNSARYSVRFWKAPSIEDFGHNIKMHFVDFNIIHSNIEQEYLSLYQILSSIALRYKIDNIQPNLAGAVIESILDGTLYPQSLLQQCISRIRAERYVNRARAAILKACLNRKIRIQKLKQKEITMALDITNTNVAYRIGRLFATLEKIQEEANPGINATIRDRFYGAASSSPTTVFPILLSLKNSHLKKIKEPRKVYFEKLIGEILSELDSFPAHLSLNEQANFAIGYYHQRQDFFTRKSVEE